MLTVSSLRYCLPKYLQAVRYNQNRHNPDYFLWWYVREKEDYLDTINVEIRTSFRDRLHVPFLFTFVSNLFLCSDIKYSFTREKLVYISIPCLHLF